MPGAAEPWIRRAVKNPALDPALIAAILQPRTEKLSDIPDKLDFFDALPDYDTELYVHKKSKPTGRSPWTPWSGSHPGSGPCPSGQRRPLGSA